jgi:hypothetical protein
MATIALPDAYYIWYLGDSMFILPGVLESLLRIMEEEYDFIFLNSRVKDASSYSVVRSDRITPFFEAFAWHLTLTGATIYSRRFQQWMRANPHPRMYRNFQQLGMILEFAYSRSNQFTAAYWYQPPAITHNVQKQSYWRNRSIQVFAQDWVELVDAFSDSLGPQATEAIIRSHDQHTRMFRLKNLVELRALDLLNPAILEAHGSSLMRACNLSPRTLRLLSALPLPLARAYAWTRRKRRS